MKTANFLVRSENMESSVSALVYEEEDIFDLGFAITRDILYWNLISFVCDKIIFCPKLS